MSLGKRLRSLRRSRKFGAELLAEACGVKAGAYRRWERDETEPSISQAIELSRIYQMSLDGMLFGGEDSLSTIAVDVEPGQQITVRIVGNDGEPRRGHMGGARRQCLRPVRRGCRDASLAGD